MSPEAWTFLGGVVAVIGGIIVVIIQNRGQSKQLSGEDKEAHHPTLRALVQSLLDDRAQEAIDTANYRVAMTNTVDKVKKDVGGVRDQVDLVRQEVAVMKASGTDFSRSLHKKLIEVGLKVDDITGDGNVST